MPARSSLSRAIGSKLPVTSAEQDVRRARRSSSSSSAMPGATRSAQVGRARLRVRRAGRVAHVVGALVDPLRADARCEQDRARDLAVGAPRRLDVRRRRVGDAVDLAQRRVERSRRARPRPSAAACRRCRRAASSGRSAALSARTSRPARGAGERGDQPAPCLDVVELDHLDRRVHVAQRDRDDAGRARRRATDVDRVGVGARAARRAASTVNGMPSASAVVVRAARRRAGCSVEPRSMTGPRPSSCLPISLTSMPGASVAWVTSTTIATSGSSA